MKPKTEADIIVSAIKDAFVHHSLDTVIKMGVAEVHLDIAVFRVEGTSNEGRVKPVSELQGYPEVASEQFILCTRSMNTDIAVHLLPETFQQSSQKQKSPEEDGKFTLSSNYFRATLSEGSTSFEYSQGLTTSIFAMRPNLFRAPTDNGEIIIS
jgi:hypothetical protein